MKIIRAYYNYPVDGDWFYLKKIIEYVNHGYEINQICSAIGKKEIWLIKDEDSVQIRVKKLTLAGVRDELADEIYISQNALKSLTNEMLYEISLSFRYYNSKNKIYIYDEEGEVINTWNIN